MPDTLPHAPRETRSPLRAGLPEGPTSGQAPSHVQGTVAIVPGAHAAGFELSCRRNAQARPVPAMSQPGGPHLPTPGAGLGVSTALLPATPLLPAAA